MVTGKTENERKVVIVFGNYLNQLLLMAICDKDREKSYQFPLSTPFQEVLDVLKQDWVGIPFAAIIVQDPQNLESLIQKFHQYHGLSLPATSLIRQKCKLAEKFVRYLTRVVPECFQGAQLHFSKTILETFTRDSRTKAPVPPLSRARKEEVDPTTWEYIQKYRGKADGTPLDPGEGRGGAEEEITNEGLDTEAESYAGLTSEELLMVGAEASERRNYEKAILLFHLALEASECEDRGEQVILCHYEVGRIYWAMGNIALALQHLYQALIQCKTGELGTQKNAILQLMGQIYGALNEMDVAAIMTTRAGGTPVPEGAGRTEGDIERLMTMGETAEAAGNLDSAVKYYRDAITIAEALDYLYIDSCYRRLGDFYRSHEQWGAALDSFYLALAHYEMAGGSLEEIALVLVEIGLAFSAAIDRYADIDTMLTQAADLCDRLGDRQTAYAVLIMLGEIYRALGRRKRATNYFRRAKRFQG